MLKGSQAIFSLWLIHYCNTYTISGFEHWMCLHYRWIQTVAIVCGPEFWVVLSRFTQKLSQAWTFKVDRAVRQKIIASHIQTLKFPKNQLTTGCPLFTVSLEIFSVISTSSFALACLVCSGLHEAGDCRGRQHRAARLSGVTRKRGLFDLFYPVKKWRGV